MKCRFPILALLLMVGFALLGCAGAPTPPPKGAKDASDAGLTPTQLLEVGANFAQTGDLVRAEQYLVAALEAGAPTRQALPILLRICVESRRYRVALEHAEGALGSDPGNSRLRFLTGSLYAATGDVPRAREHLTRAARELPRDPKVQFSLGVFSRDVEQSPAEADAYFRAYLRLEPEGAHAAEAKNALLTRLP
jgi:tetratricopeptide (TPR) repeat protein